MITEIVRPKGSLVIRMKRKGKTFKTIRCKNLVVNGGLDALVELIRNANSDKLIQTIAIGTSTTAPSSTDTAITAPVTRVLDNSTAPSTGVSVFNFTYNTTQGNGVTVGEMGLFCQDTTMFARTTSFTPFLKDNTFVLEVEWTITF